MGKGRKNRLAALSQIWQTPSDLGIRLTINGLACLTVALILNHFPMWLPPFWWWAHVIFHWGMWSLGVVFVIAGLARLMTVDRHVDG